MSQNPEEVRQDIEQTRARLGYDVDAVADKVTPSHIAHRQTEKIKGAMSGMKDKVMGTADDARASARDSVHGAGGTVEHAQQGVARKTRGNPFAAGLIAFGAGLLVSSLIPASEKEQELADTLKEKAQPLTQEVAGAAREVADHLKEPAQEAVASVKDTASSGAQNVKAEAQTQGDAVQDRVQEARQNVSDASGS
jgi:cell division septum initiation protein DivIVA